MNQGKSSFAQLRRTSLTFDVRPFGDRQAEAIESYLHGRLMNSQVGGFVIDFGSQKCGFLLGIFWQVVDFTTMARIPDSHPLLDVADLKGVTARVALGSNPLRPLQHPSLFCEIWHISLSA